MVSANEYIEGPGNDIYRPEKNKILPYLTIDV